MLLGKQLFYDARDPRLARDGYMSCATCHNDGGHDGRVWDLTGFGEGLRNTIALRGRAGMAQGFLHWSGNFDEVQDFEGQIRSLAGGTGLMTDAQFNAGTRSQPLGDAKAGVSADLDALAAYVASLDVLDASPYRNDDGSLTAEGVAGKAVFAALNCPHCHGGADFRRAARRRCSTSARSRQPTSGKRLGGATDGHRHADAARRVGDRAVPARRFGGDARGGRARARRRGPGCRRPGEARRLPAADRRQRAGPRGPAAATAAGHDGADQAAESVHQQGQWLHAAADWAPRPTTSRLPVTASTARKTGPSARRSRRWPVVH